MIPAHRIAEAEAQLARSDRPLAQLIERYGPCQIGRRRRDPFQVLASSIISQQLSTKAADTIQARVHAAVGANGRLAPAHFSGVDIAQLRACGLSNAKARWLLALAEATASGTLDFRKIRRMDDAAALAVLDALPGIGQWTAEMMLIFAFDRLEVFSMGDVGLRRGVNLLYNKGRPLNDRRTLKLTAAWAPYRSVASWYLWRMADGDSTTWV
jgi:DNA-3-methyladenine glycosylase II